MFLETSRQINGPLSVYARLSQSIVLPTPPPQANSTWNSSCDQYLQKFRPQILTIHIP